jgi:hypothetical protein
MFDAHCPACGLTGIYPLSHIQSVVNSPLGIEVAVRCWCGETFEVLLGRGPRELSRAS